MKLLSLIAIFSLCSCSSTNFLSKIDDPQNDILKNESLLRYSDERLNKIENENKQTIALISCHKGHIGDGLNKLKAESLSKSQDFQIWNNLGICYYLKSELAKAEFFFRYSLNISDRVKRKNPIANNNIGLISIQNRNYYTAQEYFQKTLKESPELITPQYNLAQLYLQFGQIEESQQILNKLYKINPKDKDIIAALGTSHMLEGNYQKSIQYFEKIDSDSLRRTDMALHYSLSLYETGQYKKANEMLKVSDRSKSQYINITRNKLQEIINNKIKEVNRAKTDFNSRKKTALNEKRR